MKKPLHLAIYIIALALSIILIGLYFTDVQNAWCVVSCSIGASLIGAVVLGFCIDYSNARNREEHSRRLFQIAHSSLYSTIYSLLMIIYIALKEFYHIKGDTFAFKYNNLTICQLIEKYIHVINEINEFIAPIKIDNKEVNLSILDMHRKQNMVKSIINEYGNSILDFRRKFNEIWDYVNSQKNLLLINDASYEGKLFKSIAVLNILSLRRSNNGSEHELIEMGNSLQKLIDCKVIDILDDIGFSNVRFNNDKDYFDINIVKEEK